MAIGLVPREFLRVAGYRLLPPCVENAGHLADEVPSCIGELSAIQQGVGDLRDTLAPPGELGLCPLPDLWCCPMPAPEAAHAHEGVGALQQTAGRPRVGAPRRVVTLAVVGQRQVDQFEHRAQLEVLRLVNEGLRAGVPVGLPGYRHGAERLR